MPEANLQRHEASGDLAMASTKSKKAGCKSYKDTGTRDTNKERKRVRHEKRVAKKKAHLEDRAAREHWAGKSKAVT